MLKNDILEANSSTQFNRMEWIVIIGVIWLVSAILNGSKKKSNNSGQGYYSKPQTSTYRPKLNIHQIDISNITLSPEQQKILNKIESTNNHFFITGKAGTGKSVLLQYFKQSTNKKVVVCAPTGVAALNVGGQTIHSLFRIPPSFIERDSLEPVNYKVALLLRNIDAVVIDEVSMVRADLMDAIDHRLRQARNSTLPFGGVQIIMFGDMYQLPPVVSDPELHKYFADNNGGYYFFNAHAWNNVQFTIYELNNVFRQKDESFITILNAVRKGNIVDQHLLDLNVRAGIQIPEDGVLTLSTTNQSVNTINNTHLEKLPDPIFEYKAIISGNLEETSFPTEELLRLKKGAQVMLLKNDKEKRWVNGTIGSIDSLNSNEIKVNLDGFVYSIPQETWSKIRYTYNQQTRKVEEEIVSSFTQYPLRLAWAITIHKSQGHTYGSVAVDMGDGAFAHGQTYVALSRCKSLEGLYLKREVVREDIIVDNSIVTFMNRAEVMTAED